MSASDDFILVTGSRNLDDGTSSSDTQIPPEEEGASQKALEGQGVSILNTTFETPSKPINVEPRDQFSQELFDEGGIEIIADNDDDV